MSITSSASSVRGDGALASSVRGDAALAPSKQAGAEAPAPRMGIEPGSVADLGERAIVERIRVRLSPAPDWLVVDVGDDAAVYEPERNALQVITTDAIVDGVHFDRAFTPPQAIGHRALAVNLSDLAAMGARPRLATLSLMLPAHLPIADLDAIVDGLLALAERTGTRLVGGNVTATPGPLVLDVTAVGDVHRRGVLTRAGARPGDYVFVSGRLGAARAGLAELRADPTAPQIRASQLVAHYLQPEPRLRLGQQLGRQRAATAAVDLSDGLADGLAQLARASGTGIDIQASDLPVHPEAREHWTREGLDPIAEGVIGGDDYELLFTVHPRRVNRLKGVQRLVAELLLTRIGVVTRKPGVGIIRPDGRRQLVNGGYEHFTAS
jgi:thiamine-monophosphate kinase